ncbi:hypothetical protein CC78DRAFT_590965 [Lojkania enalia]|uniref:Uncharacterized protein n=1 Tax=Lojkania enalia TaxID=147567 RepID=A0A9P4K0L7_9PLEO|nr:hypothetical protein CC78DRAFT_590965 [Didymosphaeria enalia]
MYLRSILLASLAFFQLAVANFVIITTDLPQSTPPPDLNDAEQSLWISSAENKFLSLYFTYIQNLGISGLASLGEGKSDLDEFLATATQFSIPAVVTDLAEITTFTTVPDWYEALPTNAKKYQEELATAVVSMQAEVFSGAVGLGRGVTIASVVLAAAFAGLALL